MYLMDFITGQEGERDQTARWEIASHNNFIFIDMSYVFAGKGKTNQKSRTATA